MRDDLKGEGHQAAVGGCLSGHLPGAGGGYCGSPTACCILGISVTLEITCEALCAEYFHVFND